MIMLFQPSKMYLNQVLDHFQTKVIVARQLVQVYIVYIVETTSTVYGPGYSSTKKILFPKNKNAYCIFLKYNNENSQETPKEHKKLSNSLGKGHNFKNLQTRMLCVHFRILTRKEKYQGMSNFQFFKRINPISLAFLQMKIYVDL